MNLIIIMTNIEPIKMYMKRWNIKLNELIQIGHHETLTLTLVRSLAWVWSITIESRLFSQVAKSFLCILVHSILIHNLASSEQLRNICYPIQIWIWTKETPSEYTCLRNFKTVLGQISALLTLYNTFSLILLNKCNIINICEIKKSVYCLFHDTCLKL